MTIRDIAISFGYSVDRASEQKAEKSIQSLKSTATKLLGAIGIGFSLVKLKALSEEFNDINTKIKDATRGMGEQAEIQKAILSAANDAKQSYGDMADTVSKLARNTDVFDNLGDAAEFSGLLYKNFMATGKSAAESHALVSRITTAISRGSMDSSVMMAMFRESPGTLRMMADSLGVSVEMLQEMASKGQISAATLRNVFLSSAGDIESRFGELDFSISDALKNIRNQWGHWVEEMNSTLKITQNIAQLMVKGFNRVKVVLRRVQDGMVRLGARLGGVDRLMKLIAISAGAIFLALNAGKILAFISAAARGMRALNLRVLALVAVFVLVALAIEDLFHFMQGNDSLLGELLEQFGIDGDEVRGIINGLLDAVRMLLPFLAELAKTFGKFLVDALKQILPLLVDFLRKILPPIMSFFRRLIPMLVEIGQRIIPVIVRIIERLLPFIIRIAETVLPALIGVIERLLPFLMDVIEKVLPFLLDLVEALLPLFMQIVETVLPILLSAIEMLLDLIMPILDAVLPLLMELLEALMPVILFVAEMLVESLGAAFEALGPVIEWAMGMFQGLIDFLTGVFAGDWGKAWDGLVEMFRGIVNIIPMVLEGVINGLIGVLNGIIWGINVASSPVRWMGVPEIPQIPEVTIPRFEKGTGRTPDTFIAGDVSGRGGELITGAQGRKVFTAAETGNIFDTLRQIAGIGAASRADTPASYVSSVENRSVVQNIQFSNQFYGERAAQERVSEAMDNAADDTTGLLARGLAYVM